MKCSLVSCRKFWTISQRPGVISWALSLTSVQFSRSVVSDSLRPHELQHSQASLSITNSRSSPKPMSIALMMPFNHLILCCPLRLLPSIFPSIRVFSDESALHIRWPKYWSFNLGRHLTSLDLVSFSVK